MQILSAGRAPGTFQVPRRASAAPVVVVLAAAALVSGLWQWTNGQWPQADAANYVMTALKVYRQFADRGLLAGLTSLYDIRAWRPVLFPDFAVPFLLVSGGSFRVAVALVDIMFSALGGAYAYLILRIALSPWRAALGAMVFVALPAVQIFLFQFFAEGALTPLILAAVYHMLRSEGATRPGHTVAWVAFSFTAIGVRPVEAMFLLASIFAADWAIAWQRGVLVAEDIGLVAVTVALTAAVYFGWQIALVPVNSPIFDPGDETRLAFVLVHRIAFWTALLAAIFASIVFVFGFFFCMKARKSSANKRINGKRSFLPLAMVGLSVLCLFWFMPFGGELFNWTYLMTFGFVARNGAPPAAPSYQALLLTYLSFCGAAALCVATGLAAIGLVPTKTSREWRSRMVAPMLVLAAALPLPLLSGVATIHQEPRKVTTSLALLFLVLCFPALGPGVLTRMRTLIFAVLAFAQVGAVLMLGLGTPQFWGKQALAGGLPPPVSETNLPTFNFLVAQSKKLNIDMFYTFLVGNRGFDPWIFPIFTYERHLNLGITVVLQMSRTSDAIAELRAKGASIVIALDPWPDLKGEEWQNRADVLIRDQNTNPQAVANIMLLARARSAEADKLGLSIVATQQTPGSELVILQLRPDS